MTANDTDALLLRDDAAPAKRYSAFMFGLFLILMVVVLWVASGEMTQAIYSGQAEGVAAFDQPFFLTYFSTSLFSLYLVVPLGKTAHRRCTGQAGAEEAEAATSTSLSGSAPPLLLNSNDPSNALRQPKWNVWQVARVSAVIAPLWISSDYIYNISLGLTSVSSNTIISSTSGAFAYLILLFMQKEKLQYRMLIGVVVSFAGICLVCLADPATANGGEESLLGDVLALIAAAIYGAQTVCIKLLLPEDDLVDMFVFFGLMGVLNTLWTWPAFFALDAIGLEVFIWPSAGQWGLLFLNGLFGSVLSDYIWGRAILITSPVLTNVGLGLTMPLSLLVDSLMGKFQITLLYMGGLSVVCVGFGLVAYAEHESSKSAEKEQEANRVPAASLA